MPRWNPDARARLVAAAVELFRERGYESVTIGEIAERAGLTRRSFFRHFPDKREVLFAGSREKTPEIAEMIAAHGDDVSARDAAFRTLTEVGDYLLHDRAAQALRQDLIASSLELQERERTKMAAMGAAVADGLRARGLPVDDAEALGAVATEAFHLAYLRATREAEPTPFADHLATSVAGITRLLTV
ncbi:TetR/AcrR family transcriptional regulator [Frondihabitans cladoniiphilus]|uniref:TetR/AcrR family transcriptional regulator n=1 Tax=Frondihabitans cladoniiphilus TaxID=715785 RepID=A0ABP8W0J7_9MICO